MLLFTAIAASILIFIAILHYRQHFSLVLFCCKRYPTLKSSQSNAANQTTDDVIKAHMRLPKKKHWFQLCQFISLDENFNYFPISFLFYVLFKIILCFIICVVEVLNYYDNTDESITDLFFGYSHKSYTNNSLVELHKINLKTEAHKIHIIVFIIDHLLIYGIMILSLWESLFSFYRYYTTVWCTTHIYSISTIKVIKKYILYYGIIFSVLFLLEIHYLYIMFPVVVILHLIFNFYCTLKFSSILTEKYEQFIDIDLQFDHNLNTFNITILKAVYFTKYTSLICCMLQSIYISLLIITYNMNVVYFLPIIWCLSCAIYCLTFVRNRNAVKETLQSVYMSLYQTLKTIKCCCFGQTITNSISNKTPPKIDEQQNENSATYSLQTSKVKSKSDFELMQHSSNEQLPRFNKNFSDPIACKRNTESLIGSLDKLPVKNKQVGKYKALQLLGIEANIGNKGILNSPTKTESKLDHHGSTSKLKMDLNQSSDPGPISNHYVTMYAQNGTKNNDSAPVSPEKNISNTPKMSIHESYKLKPKTASLVSKNSRGKIAKIIKQNSRSKIIKGNENNKTNELLLDENKNQSEVVLDDYENYDFETINMDRLNIDAILDVIGDENEEYCDEKEMKQSNTDRIKKVTVPKTKMRHAKSNSVPVECRNIDIEMFDILTKYGFCSTTTINSAKQLKNYQLKQATLQPK